jgi:chorismate mutase
MTLSEHRKLIDQLDAKIIRLLNERTVHALEIGPSNSAPARKSMRHTVSSRFSSGSLG